MDRSRNPAAGKPAAPVPAGLSPQEQAVLNAIRETPYGAIEVVMHQSRIVQIVRTEKMKVDEDTPRG
jgi:hypothetical protein